MADFPATARIPCRPLEMANKDLAEPKELLVDYSTGDISICKEDGTFTDIGVTIREIIKEDSSIAENIQIEIDGQMYAINTIVAEQNANIEELKNALGYYTDELGNIKFNLLDKIANIDPDTGNVIFNITTTDINETNEKQFVSADEKKAWSKATHPEFIKVNILSGDSAWTGTEAPYTQDVTVAGILETDTPIVDISLGDIYETIQKQLDSYAYIYKILTFNGYIRVYATQPTVDDLTVQMRIDR